MELKPEQWNAFHEKGFLQCSALWLKEELNIVNGIAEDLCLGKRTAATLAMLRVEEPYPAAGAAPPGFKGASATGYRQLGGVDYSSGLESETIIKAFAAKLAVVRHFFGLHNGVALASAALYMDGNTTPFGFPVGTHWQDGGECLCLDRDPVITAYIPLSEPRAPVLRVAPGSHARGLMSSTGGPLAPEAAERVKSSAPLQDVRVKAGEALLVHGWAVRAVPGAPGARVLVLQFVDARARIVPSTLPTRIGGVPGSGFMEVFPSAFARDASRHGLSRSRCGSSATGGGARGSSVGSGWFDRWSGRYSMCLNGEEAAAAMQKAAEELAAQLAATGISEDAEE